MVALRIEQRPGVYEGAAIPEPIAIRCGVGKARAGPWSDMGLPCYSGALRYRKQVELSEAHLRGRLILDLGRVAATAEVRVNGKPCGARVAPPWEFDVTDAARPGANTIEALVTNTLAAHFSEACPTPYVYAGQTLSGLMGPVRLVAVSYTHLRAHET